MPSIPDPKTRRVRERRVPSQPGQSPSRRCPRPNEIQTRPMTSLPTTARSSRPRNFGTSGGALTRLICHQMRRRMKQRMKMMTMRRSSLRMNSLMKRTRSRTKMINRKRRSSISCLPLLSRSVITLRSRLQRCRPRSHLRGRKGKSRCHRQKMRQNLW